MREIDDELDARAEEAKAPPTAAMLGGKGSDGAGGEGGSGNGSGVGGAFGGGGGLVVTSTLATVMSKHRYDCHVQRKGMEALSKRLNIVKSNNEDRKKFRAVSLKQV